MPQKRHVLLLLLALATGCSGSSAPTSAPSSRPTATPSTAAPVPEDPLSPRPALESPAPTGQPTCHATDLTVVDADAVVDATTWSEVYTLRTHGSPCQLQGWPAVRLLDGAEQAMRATYRTSGTPATVTLSASTSLSFTLSTPRTGSCADAAQVSVVLPGSSQALRAATTLSVCDQQVTVSPVQRRGGSEQGGG